MIVPGTDRWFRWIETNSPGCSYNLSLSAMPFPDLEEAGIETSVAEYLRNGNSAHSDFVCAVSRFLGVEEECVLPVGSASQAIYMASYFLATETGSVSIPYPEYEPIMSVPEALGIDVVPFPFGSDVPGETLHLMCSSPNNPLGREPPWLNRFVSAEDTTAFVDETFLPFSNPFRTVFRKNSGIICAGTTTKYFGLGDFKAGWLIADPANIEKLERIAEQVSPGLSGYTLWIGAQAMESEKYFRGRSSAVMDRNLKLVDTFVEETEGLDWETPFAAPYGFIRFNGEGSEELCRRILDGTGVLVVPGIYMGNDSGFRLCFTTDQEELEAALDRLREFFSSERLP